MFNNIRDEPLGIEKIPVHELRKSSSSYCHHLPEHLVPTPLGQTETGWPLATVRLWEAPAAQWGSCQLWQDLIFFALAFPSSSSRATPVTE